MAEAAAAEDFPLACTRVRDATHTELPYEEEDLIRFGECRARAGSKREGGSHLEFGGSGRGSGCGLALGQGRGRRRHRRAAGQLQQGSWVRGVEGLDAWVSEPGSLGSCLPLVCSQFPFPCLVACRIPSCFRLSILSHFACQQQQTRPKLSFSFLGGHRFLLTPFFSFLILAFEICQERVWGLMKTPPPNRLKDAGKCLWSQCQFLPCKC